MQRLTAKQLQSMLDRKEDFVLINVLPEKSFEEGHIPGSHNVPNESDSFVDDVKEIAGKTDRKIVVYCASRSCNASPEAAAKLEKAGFTNVYDFEDGMAGWRIAGFDVHTPATASR